MGKTSITYDESVEEALCYGWIDGIRKRIDAQKHTIRFSPRKPRSVWSQINVARIRRLIRDERMTEVGLEAVRVAKKNGQWQRAYGRRSNLRQPSDLKAALGRNKKAETNFDQLPPGARRNTIAWVLAAKKDETRARRIRQVVKAAAENRKPGLV